MSEHDTILARRGPDGRREHVFPDGTTAPLVGRTDRTRIAAMTDEEIETNAERDPDNPPMTDEQLARMRRALNPRDIRLRLRLTQAQFADRFGLPVETVRD